MCPIGCKHRLVLDYDGVMRKYRMMVDELAKTRVYDALHGSGRDESPKIDRTEHSKKFILDIKWGLKSATSTLPKISHSASQVVCLHSDR